MRFSPDRWGLFPRPQYGDRHRFATLEMRGDSFGPHRMNGYQPFSAPEPVLLGRTATGPRCAAIRLAGAVRVERAGRARPVGRSAGPPGQFGVAGRAEDAHVSQAAISPNRHVQQRAGAGVQPSGRLGKVHFANSRDLARPVGGIEPGQERVSARLTRRSRTASPTRRWVSASRPAI